MRFSHNINEKYIKIFSGIIIFYLVLFFINFFYNRSVWLDEAFLSLNIKERGFIELLKPLNYGQVAPIGYLLTLKTLSEIFGFHDWSLRLYSFITFLGSVYLLYQLAIRIFIDKLLSLFIVAIFLSFKPVLFYSNEVKQYMGEVFWGLLLWYLYFNFIKNPKSNKYFLLLIILGALSVWFSNTSSIIMGAIFIHYIFIEIGIKSIRFNKIKNHYRFLVALIIWGISFIVSVIMFLLNNPNKGHMSNYWQKHFMPIDIFNGNVLDFLYYEFRYFFEKFSAISQWHFYVIFLFVGLFYLAVRKKYEILVVVVIPIILHLVISGFHYYPFSDRLILYLLPYFSMAIGYSLWSFYKKLKDVNLTYIATLFLMFPFLESFLVLKNQFPLQHQEIKVALKHLNKNLKPNQQVYVYYASRYAFDFYKYTKKYPNIKSEQIVYGVRRNANNKDFRADIPKLKDDVWLIFTHIEMSNNGVSDLDNIMNLIVKHNHYKIIEKFKFNGGYLIHVKKIR